MDIHFSMRTLTLFELTRIYVFALIDYTTNTINGTTINPNMYGKKGGPKSFGMSVYGLNRF